jgi:hypothetical protein
MRPPRHPRERPLKLVVTSATLDGEKFSAYFGDCPVGARRASASMVPVFSPAVIVRGTEQSSSYPALGL